MHEVHALTGWSVGYSFLDADSRFECACVAPFSVHSVAAMLLLALCSHWLSCDLICALFVAAGTLATMT